MEPGVVGGVGRGRGAAAGQNPNNVILGAGPAAEGEDAPPVVNIMAAIAEDEPFQAIVARMRARFGDLDVQHEGDVTPGDYIVEDMKAVLVGSINGDTVLPEQPVRVGFLRSDQRLVLPYALGMVPDADFAGVREIPRDATLSTRYYQAGTLTYATIRNYKIEGTPCATIQAEVAARNPVGEALHGTVARWNTDEFYTYDNNRTDPEGVINVVFTYLSIALGFNCDIRDTKSLAIAGGRCSDGAWKTLHLVTDARLALRLRPFSMVSIAALNYAPTGNSALGGWIRAYGTSTCLLPPPANKCHREYKFTKSQPTQELRTVVLGYKKDHEDNLHALCMNILAMFGLLHLNKDHTYRPTDMNMNRICDSYIDTLQTLVNECNTDFLKQAKEVVCWTAPHPFGLAQTYFLAKVMWKYSFLSAPLMFRHNVAPPPIQRFMIIQSVIKQWSSLPAGRKLNDAFGELIAIIDAEVARIRANPPSYSGLHLYYDIPEMVTPDARAWRAVEALMPCVYGFANVLHGQDQDKSEGVALAMSLKNVERDAKAIAMMFVNLWEKYLDSAETDGLVNLAISSARLLGPGGADATVQ